MLAATMMSWSAETTQPPLDDSLTYNMDESEHQIGEKGTFHVEIEGWGAVTTQPPLCSNEIN